MAADESTFDPAEYLASVESEPTPPGQPLPTLQPPDLLTSEPVESGLEEEAFDPAKFLQEQKEEEFGTAGQTALAALEGVAEGVAGPLAPLAQRALGADPRRIRARKEVNPIVAGTGQAVGLGASLLTGVGEGALMAKAGQAVAKGAGLAKSASYGHRVGSAVVREATESAILQGSDEVAKLILQDPEVSAENAIGNIGLAAVLGGVGGGVFSGAISPLWSATAGPKVESLLTTVKNRADGVSSLVMPDQIDNAIKDLGLAPNSVMRAALSGDKTAVEAFKTLKYAQRQEIFDSITKLETDTAESVMQSLGISLKDAQVYSKAEAGNALAEAFTKEYKTRYEPLEKMFEERNKLAATIEVADEERLRLMSNIIEGGIMKVGTDAPTYHLYKDYGDRVLAKDTVGQMDALRTEIGNDIEKAMRAADYNTAHVLKDIRTKIGDFQESQILKQSKKLEEEGAEFASAIGRDIVSERKAANQAYTEFSKISNELLDHIGSGRFGGAGGVLNRISDAGAERLLKKFSPKDNAEIIPFLQKNFPETLEHIRKNELKDLIKPAISMAKGESPINVSKLNEIVEKTMMGRKELADLTLPPETLSKIKSAQTILDAIPKTRDSGTPGGLARLMSKVPASALTMVAMLLGDNPVTGFMLGEGIQQLGRNAPDAIRMGYLKFLGSEQPINSAGFKAMVDYFDSIRKGESLMANAAKAIFKSGARVLTTNHYPTEKDRQKLDKAVSRLQSSPDGIAATAQGAVGHYLPEHQTAIAQASTSALLYLQTLKPPEDTKANPLDRKVPPSAEAKARYNRALDIAQQPAVVLDRVKDGTLQISDIQDLNAMYPALYKRMTQQVTNAMISASDKGDEIPYKTRISASLFLGQPLDSSMIPSSIVAAQPLPKLPDTAVAGAAKSGKSMKDLGKISNDYKTPMQATTERRSERD